MPFVEPPDCADVVCDLTCPSDSKATRIFSYDPINLVTHTMDAVQHRSDDVIAVAAAAAPATAAMKRKRSISSMQPASGDSATSGDHSVSHQRNVNDTLAAIRKCCECKCDFNKCPEFKCPPTEYKITITQGTRIPGSCCTKFSCTTHKPTCYSHNLAQHFNPSEQWKDDACTQCECTETGETNCETPICKPLSCEKKHTIDGECCPVCDISDSKFCEPDIECDRHCRNGYEHDPVRNCAICVCAKAAVHTTKKTTATTESGEGEFGLFDCLFVCQSRKLQSVLQLSQNDDRSQFIRIFPSLFHS